MILRGAKYLDRHFQIRSGDVKICGEKIFSAGGRIAAEGSEDVTDCSGLTIVPGFIDIHLHGCGGANICDGTREALETMGRFLIRKGVTSFCPATVVADRETLERALLAAKAYMEKPCANAAAMAGVYMEGPFLSRGRIGSMMPDALVLPDVSLFRHYNGLSGGIVKVVCVAPEMPGAYEFIKAVKDECTVSVAHTCAGYDEAIRAFDCGASHATHLFNAMTGLHHRNPGVVGAVFDDPRVRAELICDGIHIHPAVLRAAFSILGERALIISDAMRAAGMPEGKEYEQGGKMVSVKDGKAVLPDGTLAGSVTDLHTEVRNLVSFGIPFEQAVRAASLIPARAIGMEAELGSIEPGKRADLVLLDEEMEIRGVYLRGRRVV